MTVAYTQTPSDPQMKDLLDMHAKNLMLNFACHHLGTVQSFNSTNQTATATINYKRTYFQRNAAGDYVPLLREYPVLVDCPVICLGGGQGALTFPITKGDECLILFNDRDIDNWFKGGAGKPNETGRLHSFSDGLILVGVRSLANVLSTYSADSTMLRFGTDKYIKINGETVEVQLGPNRSVVIAEDTVTLKAAETSTLQITSDGKFAVNNTSFEFVQALITFLTTANAGGFPIVGDISQLQSFLLTPGP